MVVIRNVHHHMAVVSMGWYGCMDIQILRRGLEESAVARCDESWKIASMSSFGIPTSCSGPHGSAWLFGPKKIYILFWIAQ